MILKVESNFYEDFLKFVEYRLKQNKIIFSTTDNSLLFNYCELLIRIPSLIPRIVKIAFEVEKYKNKYPAIYLIKRLLEEGEPTWPYLHDKIIKAEYHDKLLNDWGIYHFHLGNGFRADGFVKRTSELLYTYIENDVVYFLTVKPHKDMNSLVFFEIMNKNWPEVLEKFEMKIDTPKSEITSEQREKLRKNGVMTPIVLNGKIYIGPGFGYSLSGQSSRAQFNGTVLIDKLRQIESQLIQHINEVYLKLELERKDEIERIKLVLQIQEDGELFAFDEINNVRIGLGKI
jgi:hypothetical protein